jgi:hypothetical protein
MIFTALIGEITIAASWVHQITSKRFNACNKLIKISPKSGRKFQSTYYQLQARIKPYGSHPKDLFFRMTAHIQFEIPQKSFLAYPTFRS